MLTRARAEIAELLKGLPVSRPPAVRRAIPDDWMLACDLPQCAEAETMDRFVRCAEDNGWRIERRDGWILLDKTEILDLCAGDHTGSPLRDSGEMGCVLSLLERHPVFREDPSILRILAKASELSPVAAEPECRKLHQEMAVRLRLRSSL